MSAAIRSPRPAFAGAGGSVSSFRGAQANRQGRFDLRSAKRWGGLDLFGIPAPLLWLEDACVPSLLEPGGCIAPPIMDLWP
jgi:hypothetical protein